MVQKDFPLAENFKKGHTFGSLQHSPHPLHWPIRAFETGNMEVIVLFILCIIFFYTFFELIL